MTATGSCTALFEVLKEQLTKHELNGKIAQAETWSLLSLKPNVNWQFDFHTYITYSLCTRVLCEVGIDCFDEVPDEFTAAVKEGHLMSTFRGMVRTSRALAAVTRCKRKNAARYMYISSLLPNKWMFHLFWQVALAKVESSGKEDAKAWVANFKTRHLKIDNNVIMAQWFSGVDAKVVKGYGPWSLSPNSRAKSRLKCLMTDLPRNSTLLNLCDCIASFGKGCPELQGAPEGSPAAATGSCTTPRVPDGWMNNFSKRCKHPDATSRKCKTLAGIYHIVAHHKASNGSMEPTIRLERRDSQHQDGSPSQVRSRSLRFYVMKIFLPGPVHAALAKSMVDQLRSQSEEDIKRCWVERQVLPNDTCGINALTRMYTRLSEMWLDHCVVSVIPSKDCLGYEPVQCSCFFARSRGHCPHEYAVQQLLDDDMSFVDAGPEVLQTPP